MKQRSSEWHELNTIAWQIVNALLEQGVVVQKYNSHGTSSIYLKFDYGIANSLRISDHDGKDRLKYRFNIRTDIDAPYEIHPTAENEWPQYFFTKDQVNTVISRILSERNLRLQKYGESAYHKFMDRNKNDTSLKGFWRNARLITEPKYDHMPKPIDADPADDA